MPLVPVDINNIQLDNAPQSGLIPVDLSSIKLDEAPQYNDKRYEALARGALQGGTAGFADEIQAGLAPMIAENILAPLNGLSAEDVRAVGGNGTPQEQRQNLYKQSLNDIRAKDEEVHKTNPGFMGAGEFVGAIPTAAKAIGMLPEGLLTAETGLGSALKSGVVGAGYGAINGAGTAEGNDNIIDNAEKQAIVGGLLGAGGDAVLRGATGLLSSPSKLGFVQENSGLPVNIPMSKGQFQGDDDLIRQQYELAKKTNSPKAVKVLDELTNAQKDAAESNVNQILGVNENEFGRPSYQNLTNDVITDVRGKGQDIKGQAIDLRNKAEEGLTGTVPQPFVGKVMDQINKELLTFDSADADATTGNILKNITRKDNGITGNDSNAVNNEAGAGTQGDEVGLQNLFNAQKALSKQKNAVGAKSAAAKKASDIIDENINQWIKDKVVGGDVDALQAFRDSTPLFRQYYQNYENTSSTLFNKILKNPDNVSPDGFFNSVFGRSLSGSDYGRNAIMQVRRTLGDEGINKLKQGFGDSLISRSQGADGALDLVKLKKNLNNYLSNESFSSTLNSAEELNQLKVLRADLGKVTRNPKNINSSGTAYTSMRLKESRIPVIKHLISAIKNAKDLKAAKEMVAPELSGARPILGGIGNLGQKPLQITIDDGANVIDTAGNKIPMSEYKKMKAQGKPIYYKKEGN